MEKQTFLMPDTFVVVTLLTYNDKWPYYEGWNFNSGNYLFTTDTK